jgi:hypothetical protein
VFNKLLSVGLFCLPSRFLLPLLVVCKEQVISVHHENCQVRLSQGPRASNLTRDYAVAPASALGFEGDFATPCGRR